MKAQRGKTPGKKVPVSKRKNTQTDPVQVYCRIRPLDNPELPTCVKVLSPNSISVKPGPNSHAVKVGVAKESEYTFENVYDEYSPQKSLFEHIAQPLVEDVMHGKDALLFAYGVTSSGKTYTMTGSPQDQGILPRCLDVIFNSITDLQAKKYVFKPDKMNGYDIQSEADAMLERQRRDIMPKLTQLDTPKTPGNRDRRERVSEPRIRETGRVEDVEEDNSYCVFVSYVEIYNNYVYDLLEELQYDPITGYKPPTSKTMREDQNRNMYVSNVIEVEVKSTEEAYEVINKGQKRRKVAHTTLNTESSRSHSVFTVRLVQAPLDPRGEEPLQDKEKICVSQLALVDLAGSERTNRTNSRGDRLREAGNINQSLMVLRSCIEALRENQLNNANKMVPYRDSRLTHLFKNYFDGEGRVRMVVCVNPHEDDYDETIQVMKFAELTREVQVARPQQVRFDVGLTRGRRQINKRYQEAIRQTGDDADIAPLPEPMIYSMGGGFPSLELTSPVDAVTLVTLMDYLKQRELKRMTQLSDLASKEELFRKRILMMEQENIMLRDENEEMKAKLSTRSTEVGHIQRRVRSLEKANEALQRTANHFQSEKRDMEKELDDKDYQIRKAQTERVRLRQDYQVKIAMTEQELEKQMEETKRKLQRETDSQIRSKQQKLDILRNIVNQESDVDSVYSSSSSAATPRPHTRTVTSRYLEATASSRGRRVLPAKSEPDLSMVGRQETPRAIPKSNPTTTHLRSRTAAPAPKTPAPKRKSPPPIKPKPAMNPRHRRSRSHDVWLEHKPVGTVDTGSILQPAIKRKKSVSKLTEKATKDVSKYILTHQEADSDGDIATKLVKGDVIPTAGGGTSVVFNDVETIRQSSPGDRKRRSPQLHPEDFEGEWTDTEDRCKTAIEHHGHLKRLKSSAV